MKEYFHSNLGLFYQKTDISPEKTTLVFMHGLSGSSSAWKNYEEFFSNQYNIISFDLRGHGKSVKPAGYDSYSIENFTDDLNKLMKHLEIEKFILISHSFGTMIAFEYIKQHSNKIEAAVFLSPSLEPRKQFSAKILKPFLSLTSILSLFPFSNTPQTHVDYSKYIGSGDWNIKRMIADISNTSLRVYLYATKQSYQYNGEQCLEKINFPCLFIHGKKDSIFPFKNSIFLSNKIKNSKLVLLESADHILVLNNFSEISKSIKNFLVTL